MPAYFGIICIPFLSGIKTFENQVFVGTDQFGLHTIREWEWSKFEKKEWKIKCHQKKRVHVFVIIWNVG